MDTKWKRISARIDDPKQGVSQGDVYQMMSYGQLSRCPCLTLLYPHHKGLGDVERVHSRHRFNELNVRDSSAHLSISTFDVSDGRDNSIRLRRLLDNIPQ